ncbi:PGF-pre-PGF domain-containing protein [Haloferax namakaokahaiae]|uniref:PGF-pre-PGF domain-containing protein n=1 Tax=Haloferax namakaokahaiae TaxID=1748331 RepID=A0ABD5ZBX7_9EURY
MSRRRRLSLNGLSLTLSLIVVLSVVAGPAAAGFETTTDGSPGGVSPANSLSVPDDELTNATENISVWDGSILTLRPNKTDPQFQNAAEWKVKTGNTFVRTDQNTKKDLLKNPAYVYKKGERIPFTFQGIRNVDLIDGEDVQLVAAKVESGASVPRSPAAVAENLTTNDDITAKVVADGTGKSGVNDFSFTPTESGIWMVAVVTVDDGTGFSDANDDGNLETNGNVTVVGVDAVPVHERKSCVVTDPLVKQGETTTVDVNACGLSGDVRHTIAVFNETALDQYDHTINATDRDDVTVETEIAEINGSANLSEEANIMGIKPGSQSFSGTTTAMSLFERLNNSTSQSRIDGVTVVEPKATVYATAVTTVGPADTSIDVPVPEGPDGEYVLVHVATEKGTTKTVSNRELLRVYESAPWTRVVPGSVSISPTSVEAGEEFTVTVTMKNYGTKVGQCAAKLKADGNEIGRQCAKLDPGKTKTLTYTVSIDTPGTYTLRVNSESIGSITVTEASGGGGSTGGGNDGGGGGYDGGTDDDDDDGDTPAGGGGGGGNAGPPLKADGTYDSSQLSLEKKFDGSLPDGRGVTGLSIGFDSTVRGKVTVRERAGLPGTLGRPTGKPVSWLQIDVPDAVEDEPATLTLTVKRSKLDELGVSADDLQVERYDDDTSAWETLETRVVNDSGETVVIEAETPGFSYFAVVAKQVDDGGTTTAEPTPTEETTTTEEPTPTEETATTTTAETETTAEPTTTSSPVPGFGVVVALVALLAVALAAVRHD